MSRAGCILLATKQKGYCNSFSVLKSDKINSRNIFTTTSLFAFFTCTSNRCNVWFCLLRNKWSALINKPFSIPPLRTHLQVKSFSSMEGFQKSTVMTEVAVAEKTHHSPDRQHSASSGLNVLDIGRRYVRVPKWFHGFVWNHLSQNTCGAETQRLSARQRLKETKQSTAWNREPVF